MKYHGVFTQLELVGLGLEHGFATLWAEPKHEIVFIAHTRNRFATAKTSLPAPIRTMPSLRCGQRLPYQYQRQAQPERLVCLVLQRYRLLESYERDDKE